MGTYLYPDVAFDSTTLFDWTTLTIAVLTPHAESLPITDYNGEPFELVSPVQSMEVEGTTTSMRMLGGPILLDLTRGSQRCKLTHGAHINSSKAKSKSNFSWPSLMKRLLHKANCGPRWATGNENEKLKMLLLLARAK